MSYLGGGKVNDREDSQQSEMNSIVFSKNKYQNYLLNVLIVYR